MPLREATTVFADNQRNVGKSGRLPAELLVNLHLTERAGQQIVAAQNFSHARLMIVHNNGELIRRRAIRFADDEIAKLFLHVARLRPGDEIVEVAPD